MAANISVTVTDQGFPVDTGFKTDVSGKATLIFLFNTVREATTRIAYEVLLDEQSKGQFPKDKNEITVITDGKVGKSPDKVNPFGSVVFTRKLGSAASVGNVSFVMDIYQSLLQNSPRQSGTYQANHVILYNRKEVARTQREAFIFQKWLSANIQDNDVIQFINVAPYASNLEREGITRNRRSLREVKTKDKRKRSGAKVRAPNGVYFLAYKALNSRGDLKGIAFSKFEFIQGAKFSGSVITKVKRSTQFREDFHPDNPTYKGPYTYPSIRIYIRKGSTVSSTVKGVK